MPATTSRLALPYPVSTDPADVPADLLALANKLDPLAAVFAQGTLAARPAAAVPGRLYYDTTTPALWYDTGTAWAATAGASAPPEAKRMVGTAGQPAFVGGWVNLDASRAAYFYKDRECVYLGGAIKSGVTGTTAFVLPAGYRPAAIVVSFAVNATAADAGLGITDIGEVIPSNVGGSNVSATCYLDGITFRAA